MGTVQNSSSSSETAVSKDLPRLYANAVRGFLFDCGISASSPEKYDLKDFYAYLIRDLLKIHHIQRGRISCAFAVLPAVTNIYNALLGGAIGGIAERMAIACARTVVAEDKELFLGELSMSYLSATQQNEVLMVDGCVVRSGRNLTVVAIEFRIKKTGKLVYACYLVSLAHCQVVKFLFISSKMMSNGFLLIRRAAFFD